MNDFETIIGLEVHAQLSTESKIFCSCSTEFNSPPNTNICPVCCGYPGVLPVFNQKVLELAVRVSIALGCRINRTIYFERKNYFYPDLPKNYQISQYKMPLGQGGHLALPEGREIRINRVHMEEDAGKLIHKEGYSLVDFNRTGMPLLEIVSEPDIKSPQEAFEYLNQLKLILKYIGASDCDMEKGSLRCDANISLRPAGQTEFGTKVELKNMNTFRGVRAALEYEVKRQTAALNRGEAIIQETRLWDSQKMASAIMRTKEEAHDYRYFPEPDLVDFFISDECIDKEKSFVGEMPLEKQKRFRSDYGLTEKDIDVYLLNPRLALFFEEVVRYYSNPREVSNWVLGPLLEQVNALKSNFETVKISAANFSKVVKYFHEGKLNNLTAKKALALSIETNEDIDEIILSQNLAQVSSQEELAVFVKESIEQNPKAVTEYYQGKKESLQFLMGQVMKKTRGKANPKIAKELLEEVLKNNRP
ncbi:MAG: Asp-tRNA(Asn)/Glu-tRNA(Gln) amidotransferase subunit GatB [Candidatus Omnitrophica bacterium]|nr:Asp-tRNA(Asn)/Glu-tRNA(Gln) amidotransferase subunit GatB [Candidatus Omnitrophota bacterium]MDD5430301.1 Asp-tRNA(Asn)/Glu-tRNA(Gln) amidotransferase subunit GatB [Candidatus Omnitrophota bacterium]